MANVVHWHYATNFKILESVFAVAGKRMRLSIAILLITFTIAVESLTLRGEWQSGIQSPTVHYRPNQNVQEDVPNDVVIEQQSLIVTPDISLYDPLDQKMDVVFECRITANHLHDESATEVAMLVVKRNPASASGILNYPIFPEIENDGTIKIAVYNTGMITQRRLLDCDEIYYASLYISTASGKYFVVPDDRRVTHSPLEILVPFEVSCPDREDFRPADFDHWFAFSRSLYFNQLQEVGYREENNVILLEPLPLELEEVRVVKPGPDLTLRYSHLNEDPFSLFIETSPSFQDSGLVFDVAIYANAPLMGPPLVSYQYGLGNNETTPIFSSAIIPGPNCDALVLPESETFVCISLIDPDAGRIYFHMRDVWNGLSGMEHIFTAHGERPCLRIPHRCEIWEEAVDFSPVYGQPTVASFGKTTLLARTDTLQNVAFFVQPLEQPLRKITLKTVLDGNLDTNTLVVTTELEHIQFVSAFYYPLNLEIYASVTGCAELGGFANRELLHIDAPFRIGATTNGTIHGTTSFVVPEWLVGYPIYLSIVLRSASTGEVVLTQTAGSYTHFSMTGACIAYRFGDNQDKIPFPFPSPIPSSIPTQETNSSKSEQASSELGVEKIVVFAALGVLIAGGFAIVGYAFVRGEKPIHVPSQELEERI